MYRYVEMNPKKTIIICLDLDETLINSSTKPSHLIDFNGSSRYGDPSAWLAFLTEIKRHCELYGFQLIVQIISVKKGGVPSDLVDVAALHLSPFLHNLDKKGRIVSHPKVTSRFPVEYPGAHTHYCFMTHLGWHPKKYAKPIQEVYWEKIRFSGGGLLTVNDEEILPPIHLCYDNYAKNCFSKALVMQIISEHFYEPIPAGNVFLLDNDLSNIKEVQTGSNGLTPCYQAMSAHALEALKYDSKELRTIACLDILERFKNKILSRVSAILADDDLTMESGEPWRSRFRFSPTGSCMPFFKPVSAVPVVYSRTGPHLKQD